MSGIKWGYILLTVKAFVHNIMKASGFDVGHICQAFLKRPYILDVAGQKPVIKRHVALFAGNHQKIDLREIITVAIIAPAYEFDELAV